VDIDAGTRGSILFAERGKGKKKKEGGEFLRREEKQKTKQNRAVITPTVWRAGRERRKEKKEGGAWEGSGLASLPTCVQPKATGGGIRGKKCRERKACCLHFQQVEEGKRGRGKALGKGAGAKLRFDEVMQSFLRSLKRGGRKKAPEKKREQHIESRIRLVWSVLLREGKKKRRVGVGKKGGKLWSGVLGVSQKKNLGEEKTWGKLTGISSAMSTA